MPFSALWFGPPDDPLFGRLHVPDGGSGRAAIVLCPPVGLESTCASHTYRVLGQRLEKEGFAVLRLDYQGTGDSSGSGSEPGRVGAWQGSVRAAVEFVRSCGARKVAAVGMRLGATVLATVAHECDLDSLVLWDPCDSGRSYLREQQALRSMHLGDQALAFASNAEAGSGQASPPGSDDPRGIEVLGDLYAAKTVEELSQLSIEAAEGDLARRVLVLVRPERRARKSLTDRLSMAHVEWGEAIGQGELVDVQPGMARVPEDTVGAITSWLSSGIERERSEFSTPRRESAVIENRDGNEVVEEIVRLGPLRLFGILTHPPLRRSAVTVVILNSGIVDHVGPGRLSVHLARCCARAGLPALRVDLSGLGDSPVRPGQEEGVVFPPEFFDDLGDISRAVSPSDPSALVLVGLCSGAYHSVEGGIAIGAKGVCLINPILPRNPLDQPDRALSPRPPDPRRRATAARRPWVKRLPAHDRLVSLADQLPGPAWWLFDRIGVELPPARALARLVNMDVDTLVVCGEREARLIKRGEGAVLRRLRRTGRFRLEVVRGADHELFQRAARDAVEPMVTGHLAERFVSQQLSGERVE